MSPRMGCSWAATAALLLVLLLPGPSAASSSSQRLRIPRIIHRNYMAGAAALQAATVGPQPDFKAHWLASCTTHNPGWQEVIWDEPAVLQLMQSDFPWFLPTYLSYPRLVQRSDAMRYMVLYKYGGIYLDADVECYASMEQSLQDQDLVLSCEEPGAWGQLHNAAMASTAGHPFWLAVLQEAVRRSPAALAQGSGPAAQRLRQLWRRTPFHDGLLDVLRTTGPILLTDVYRAHTGGAPACGQTVTVGGRTSTAYPVGAWFTPCLCVDDDCLWRWNVQHFKLLDQQQQGESGEPALLQKQTRRQRRDERWHRHRWQQQQQQQQRRDMQSPAVLVEELTPQQRQLVVGIHQYSASWTGWDQSHRVLQQQQMRQEMSRHVLEHLTQGAGFLQHSPVAAGAAKAPATTNSCLESAAATNSSGLVALLGSVLDSTPHSPCTMLTLLGWQEAAGDSGTAHSSVCRAGGVQAAASTCASDAHASAEDGANNGCCNSNCSSSSSSGCGGKASDARLALSDPAAATQQLQRQAEQLARELGCASTLAAASVPWPAVQQDAAQAMALPASWRVVHSNSTAGGSGQRVKVFALHDVLVQHQDANKDASHVLQVSCPGCELSLLRHLLAPSAANSSVLEGVRVLLLDVTLLVDDVTHHTVCQPGAQHNSNGDGSCALSGGSSASGSSSGGAPDAFTWADVHNLLHQQLGFRGFWRGQVDSSRVQLGWVLEPIPADARLQAPDSPPAQGVLQAASAATVPAELSEGVCSCCQACCGGSGGMLQHRWYPLWQRAACHLSGAAGGSKRCAVVSLAKGPVSGSSGSGGSSTPLGDGLQPAAGGCDGNTQTGCSCQGCCACTPSLWGVLQQWLWLHEAAGNSSTRTSAVGGGCLAGSVLVACLVVSGMLLLRAARKAALDKSKLFDREQTKRPP